MSLSVRRGFTLVELLVVIAILSILAMLGVGNFQTARIKARDTERKSDLSTIAKSLEAYNNDHQAYPTSSVDGLINCKVGATCAWGSPFTDDNDTIYAAQLPDDESVQADYFYQSATGADYTLYARLENAEDPAIDNTIAQDCGGVTCNYKITSSNLIP